MHLIKAPSQLPGRHGRQVRDGLPAQRLQAARAAPPPRSRAPVAEPGRQWNRLPRIYDTSIHVCKHV